jgi:outer membrane protein
MKSTLNPIAQPRAARAAAASLYLALLLSGLPVFADEPAVTLTLQDATEIAQKNHPQYAAAQLQAFLAQEALNETRSGYFPVANGFVTGAGATQEGARLLAGGLNNPSIYDRVAGGVVVSQLITDFGRTGSLVASAKAEVRGATAGAEASRAQVVLNAETSYLAALQAQSVLAVARQTLTSRKLVISQVKALADNQLKSSLDVSFAQVAVEEADLLVQQSEGQLESAMASLSEALGYRRQRLFVLTEVPQLAGLPVAVEDLIDMALRERPDLLRLRDQRDAAISAADAERDANYPTLAAVGAAGNAPWRDSHLQANYAAAGVQLSVPIFAGGAFIAREHEAQIRARVADEALREAEDTVARDVRVAWAGFKTALQRFHTTEQLVKHATESFDLAQARYKVGSSSVIELSEAQLSQTSAEITQVNARYDTLIDKAVLDYQIGAIK